MNSTMPYLPPELWSIIIGYIRREELPACAAVCRGWQLEVEKFTFHTLFVRSNDLTTLHHCFEDERRQLLIRSLVFCIELPESLDFGDSNPSIQNDFYRYFDVPEGDSPDSEDDDADDDWDSDATDDDQYNDKDSDEENNEEDALVERDPDEETDQDLQEFQDLPNLEYLDNSPYVEDIKEGMNEEELQEIKDMIVMDEDEEIEELGIMGDEARTWWSDESPEDRAEMCRQYCWQRKQAINNVYARDCVTRLFEIMSKWKNVLDNNPGGIALELTTESLDDEKQLKFNRFMGLRRYHGVSFGLLDNIPPVHERPPTLGTHHHETYFTRPHLYTLVRSDRLPEVPAISSFCILRRCFSDINEFSRLAMIQSMPNVKEVSQERWHTLGAGTWYHYSGLHEGAEPCFLVSQWPASVKSIFHFQARGDMFTRTNLPCDAYDGRGPAFRGIRRFVHRGLAPRSLMLEELGVCYAIVDAEHFFEAWGPGTKNIPTWPHLRLFTMTTWRFKMIHVGWTRRFIRRLAQFVARMPVLEVLEIFWADDRLAGLFQISTEPLDQSKLIIQWMSTRPTKLGSRVKREWQAAFSGEGETRSLEFRPEIHIDRADYVKKGPMDFIENNLLTKDKILSPQTLRDLAELRRSPDWDKDTLSIRNALIAEKAS